MKAVVGFILGFGFILMLTVLAEASAAKETTSSFSYINSAVTLDGRIPGPVGVRVVVRKPTAPRAARDTSACPGRDYFWIEGRWNWNDRHDVYEWVHGYRERLRPGYRCDADAWVKAKGGYSWHAGIWVKRYASARKEGGLFQVPVRLVFLPFHPPTMTNAAHT